jgi:hypothetical protein
MEILAKDGEKCNSFPLSRRGASSPPAPYLLLLVHCTQSAGYSFQDSVHQSTPRTQNEPTQGVTFEVRHRRGRDDERGAAPTLVGGATPAVVRSIQLAYWFPAPFDSTFAPT